MSFATPLPSVVFLEISMAFLSFPPDINPSQHHASEIIAHSYSGRCCSVRHRRYTSRFEAAALCQHI
jgi:hypothetical protein